MRYLLNLPLLIGFLATGRAFTVAVVLGSPGGGDATLGAAYEILFETVIIWLMLAIVLAGCGAMGGFRWPRVSGFGGVLIGLLAFAGIALVSLSAVGVAMELSTSDKWGIGQVATARFVAFGLPFVIILYGGWIVNAPMPSRDSPVIHGAALGVTGLLCLVALVVTMREIDRQGRDAQVKVAAQNREEDEKDDEARRRFAKLTEADSLFEWSAYLHDNVPRDLKAEASRRVLARPRLESELAQVIVSGNTPWASEAFSLILTLKLTPTQALVQPVRQYVSNTAERLTREYKDITYDGDKRVDYYERYTIDDIMDVAVRMAETTGADLSDSIDAVVRAVALYPKSDTARILPAKAAAARKRIAQILAAEHK